MTPISAPAIFTAAPEPIHFIEAETRLQRASLVPEISLHLASDARGIWQAADDAFGTGRSSYPFWAFAWPGGQALARHLLDHAGLVRDRTVIDLGSGSAIAGIAAMLAGARCVLAADIDPVAAAAALLNGRANGVDLAVTTDDLLATTPACDVVIVGDLVYMFELATRVTAFLEMARKHGAVVLFGDRTSARRPRLDFRLLAEHEAPLMPALEEDFIEHARVWQALAVPHPVGRA